MTRDARVNRARIAARSRVLFSAPEVSINVAIHPSRRCRSRASHAVREVGHALRASFRARSRQDRRHRARAAVGHRSEQLQEVVFGNVIPSVKAPNIAREIVLGTGLPRKIPGLHRRRSVRVVEPGHHLGRRHDLPRLRRHRHRRRQRVAVRHPHPLLEELRRGAGGREQAEERGREARLVQQDPSEGSRAGRSGHRRIDDRPDDGRVGREDGQGERHHARGAGPRSRCRAITAPPRRRRAAGSKTK